MSENRHEIVEYLGRGIFLVLYWMFIGLFVFVIFVSLFTASSLEVVVFGLILLPVYFIPKKEHALTYMFWFFIIGVYVVNNAQWFEQTGLSSQAFDRYKANKPLYVKQINQSIDAGKIDEATKLIAEYYQYDDPDILALKNKISEIRAAQQLTRVAELQKQIDLLKPDDYEARDKILQRIVSTTVGNTYENQKAVESNRARWDKAKAMIGTYQEDCKSDYAKILANNMLQTFVKKRLIAPASASFPWPEPNAVKVTKPCDFEIIGYVDSQNRYGAMVRKYYTGKLTRNLKDKDVFTLLHLEM